MPPQLAAPSSVLHFVKAAQVIAGWDAAQRKTLIPPAFASFPRTIQCLAFCRQAAADSAAAAADDANAEVMAALRSARRRGHALKAARDKLLLQVGYLPLRPVRLTRQKRKIFNRKLSFTTESRKLHLWLMQSEGKAWQRRPSVDAQNPVLACRCVVLLTTQARKPMLPPLWTWDGSPADGA